MAVPKKDSLLAAFSQNFNDRIVAARETYHLSDEQVALYTDKHTRFAQAYTELIQARAQGIRSEAQTALKSQTKRELQSYARSLYGILQSDSSISDSDKILLGIHIAGDARSIPRPTACPGVSIHRVTSRTVVLGIYDADTPTRKGRAPNTAAAWVYTFVGSDYPSNNADWTFAGAWTKGKYSITFPSNLPAGAQVWICAAWVSPTQEPGPMSMPICTNLQGGGSAPVSAGKIAA